MGVRLRWPDRDDAAVTSLQHLNHMRGDTVTPRHYNILIDVINAQADVIEALITRIDHLAVLVDRNSRR